ncbi:MAG TPA: PhzF family phenazine biosynthesis protein, partial [Caulobacteraceae bacterium]|nr:PhzF family phenazine biosynthesis protein [Caulobacteraceae bacterium]
RPLEVWAGAYLMAILADEAAVRTVSPDLAAIKTISSAATDGRGNVSVSALAAAGSAYDVVSRFFAPGSGIPEDPTTGSLHCALTPLFAEKLSRPRLAFHQAYPGRGGDLVCELRGGRVLIEGRAVTIADSRLRLEL